VYNEYIMEQPDQFHVGIEEAAKQEEMAKQEGMAEREGIER